MLNFATGDFAMLKFLALIGLLTILGAIGAAAFFFGGFYNVGASAEDPAAVDWLILKVREASIARNAAAAAERPPMPLDSPTAIQQGARAYSERGCVTCHGAPGMEWAKFSEGMRPYPPDIKEHVDSRTPRELFWIVKNGVKMTAMPGFGLIEVPDRDIWTIVAFLKKLPNVSEADYKAWTAPAPAPTSPPP
jgi:mono/diheme cytochrome c family protein